MNSNFNPGCLFNLRRNDAQQPYYISDNTDRAIFDDFSRELHQAGVDRQLEPEDFFAIMKNYEQQPVDKCMNYTHQSPEQRFETLKHAACVEKYIELSCTGQKEYSAKELKELGPKYLKSLEYMLDLQIDGDSHAALYKNNLQLAAQIDEMKALRTPVPKNFPIDNLQFVDSRFSSVHPGKDIKVLTFGQPQNSEYGELCPVSGKGPLVYQPFVTLGANQEVVAVELQKGNETHARVFKSVIDISKARREGDEAMTPDIRKLAYDHMCEKLRNQNIKLPKTHETALLIKGDNFLVDEFRSGSTQDFAPEISKLELQLLYNFAKKCQEECAQNPTAATVAKSNLAMQNLIQRLPVGRKIAF